jgi:two-component system, chemotaxis family, protein-glutamate methylesterase/glutaminase
MIGNGPRSAKPSDAGAPRRLHVMVVDDSAVAREVMSSVLAHEFTVTTASDPLIAMDKIGHARPDVILLDLEMPRMHGLTFLRLIRQESAIPVVVCSSLAGRGTDMALRALEQGAVDVVAKPAVGVREFLLDAEILLCETVRGAAQARGRHARVGAKTLSFPVFPPPPSIDRPAPATIERLAPQALPRPVLADSLIALGASTGGTEALREILERLPRDAPPVVVVQHMPELFTAAFARRLNECCQVSVKEAAAGDELAPGRVLIAPGNRHLVVRRQGRHYFVEVSDGPLVSRHRPSVDVLFRSVAAAAGPHAVGALLTGMGDDGADGLLEMKRAGARTIAQDEATSVVFGMPKEAIARKAADQIAPLSRIPFLLLAGAGAPTH